MVVREVVVMTVVVVVQFQELVVTMVIVAHQFIGLAAVEVVVMAVVVAHLHRLGCQMTEVLAMGVGTPGDLRHLEGGWREEKEETNQRSLWVTGTSPRLSSSNLVVTCA